MSHQIFGVERGYETLRRFARRPNQSVERCELCASPMGPDHPHLLELGRRRLLCACSACAMLFSDRPEAKYKRLPRTARYFPNFRMTDAEWDGLRIPINLAFFFETSTPQERGTRVTAMFPSPAGATESLLPLEAWSDLVESNPVLRQMQPDVEALLVNRVGAGLGASEQYYLAPIDVCFKLVGLVRVHWRGLSGGTEVWEEIGKFFSELRAAADVVLEDLYA